MKKFSLLCLLTLFCSIPTCFAVTLIDGIYYNFGTTQPILQVTYYAYQSDENGQAYYGDIVIPEKVMYRGTEYTVKSIDTYAFAYCYDLTSVTLPETINDIDEYAFWNCDHLESVNIPEAVQYIGAGAFYGCSILEEVNIPSAVTTIHGYTCYECLGLKTLTMGNDVERIDSYAFTGCSSLESIAIPDKVTSIPAFMCEGCTNLTTVKLGASVKEIGTVAFQTCTSLKEVYSYNPEPPTVGSTSFQGTSIKRATLYVPKGTTDTYRAADTWGTFSKIKEMDDPDPDADGINSVSVDASEVEGIYSTSGQKLNTTVKGVNIIRYNDGTVKKIYVK